MKANKALARKVLSVVDKGLVSGLGKPVPGQMCVEAAVCYAMGLPHGDEPTCVSSVIRTLKIALNDTTWSSPEARAKGMRRLAIAQLGSAEKFDDNEFAKRLANLSIGKTVPSALRAVASIHPSLEHKKALEEAAIRCEKELSAAAVEAAWRMARAAARALSDVRGSLEVWEASESAARAAWAASCVNSPARWAASTAVLAAKSAGKRIDQSLSEFAEDVVQILIDMKAPGTKWLDITEAK